MRTIAFRLPVLRTPKPRKTYNPIEQFFVKTKHLLGQVAGRTSDAICTLSANPYCRDRK